MVGMLRGGLVLEVDGLREMVGKGLWYALLCSGVWERLQGDVWSCIW